MTHKGVPTFKGISQDDSYLITYKEITAIACRVNSEHFSQEKIDRNLKDPEWLKVMALHHHEVIERIHKRFTVLPLSFCTIFTNEENLKEMLSKNYSRFLERLNYFFDKQEWNLKVYCDVQSLRAFVIKNNPAVLEFQENLSHMSSGKQYIMREKNLII
ncbi:GvpL/GvpF family gas vesicle protein [Ammoniphilus sp. 3BR4]|uniref:GvpL/GvpF family gas vesicle protein n=1 Tax=Ammoniphilus sp. 3BR4 TaxID=3158265 RepID=UPI0034651BF3